MLDGWAVPALGFAFTKLSVSLFRTDPGRIHDDVIFWARAYVAARPREIARDDPRLSETRPSRTSPSVSPSFPSSLASSASLA